MDTDIYELCRKNLKENPFRRHMEFLHENGELPEAEKALYDGIAKEFLSLIETIDMVKVCKMPILYSFYNHGNFRLEATAEDVLKA